MFKNFWNMIGDFFDLIPKVIYFLYASFASAVDAMQALVRKLAGLDVYYQAAQSGGAQAIARKDPLTEFIYGIVGYGDNAAVYKGLNTVFWSLAIFAVIILAVSTMVAIIKSHYNEDTAGTSPWKYIYQAIKAALTFVIVPVVVLLGMRLNTFVLSTLDRIIAGSASDEQIVAVYGSTEMFEPGNVRGTTDKSYIYYDYFGAGDTTTTTTFSGMLFKAAAYSSNRARTGDFRNGATYASLASISVGGKQIFARSDSNNYTNSENKQEYVAYQVDFAFQNNLHTSGNLNYNQITNATELKVSSVADMFASINMKSFTKFNPALVWQFYNLWKFNFIIGFAGVFATFSMMISIILGLMSRLIKGAALFLIYPALLGLAPLDNFKAFKEWSSQFIKQILMAIGSIVGFNLLLLILPYIQTIKFYNIGVIDAIIDVVLLVVGLVMAKDFISMVSGFVGGADALSVGGGMKGDVSANLKKGIGTTAKIGLGTARVTGKMFNSALVKPIKKMTASKRANWHNKKAKERETEANVAEGNLKKAQEQQTQAFKNFYNDNSQYRAQIDAAGRKARKEYDKTHKKGTDAYDEKERDALALKARQDEMRKITKGGNPKLVEADKNVREAQGKFDKAQEKYDRQSDLTERISKKYNLTNDGGKYSSGGFKGTAKSVLNLDKVGGGFKNIGAAISQMGRKFSDSVDSASLGKTIADVFTKNVQNIGAQMGIDKVVNGAKDVFKGTFTFKGGAWDAKPELSGDKLAKDSAKKAQDASQQQIELLKKIADKQEKTEKNTSRAADAAETTSKKSSGGGSAPTSGSGGDSK